MNFNKLKIFSKEYFFRMLSTKTILPTNRNNHSATVIFFHGSGDTGDNLLQWVRFLLGKDMEFPHIKIIYPTAPLQPYTPMNKELSNVWFDRKEITIEAREVRSSLASIYEKVGELLKNEMKNGIPASRIVVGGFSMGGALALHTGFHVNQELGGIFTCSSFLNRGSIVYDSIRNKNTKETNFPELLMFHGDRDSVVPMEWGNETFENLTQLGITGKFIPIKKTMHELKKLELLELQEWINGILPPLNNNTEITNKL